MSLMLERIKRTDPRILANMRVHYSAPKGFVGRNICYAVMYGGVYYGAIVGGSATLHLPGRNSFFGGDVALKTGRGLGGIINNIFFHVEKVNGRYPARWFTVMVLSAFRKTIVTDWKDKYGNEVIGFETLVELPRTGDCYLRDGWTPTGTTKGFTCKRTSGIGSDGWGGKRIWNKNMDSLRPKIVFCRKAEAVSI